MVPPTAGQSKNPKDHGNKLHEHDKTAGADCSKSDGLGTKNYNLCYPVPFAGLAELADAPDSKSGGRKAV